jgi:hypothetical protein
MGNVVKFGKRPAKPEAPKVSMVPTWFDDRFNYDPHWLTDALCMSDNGVARETDACGPPELPLQFAGTGERVPMIKPQQQQVEVPSPIESLATTIALMAANRKFLGAKVTTLAVDACSRTSRCWSMSTSSSACGLNGLDVWRSRYLRRIVRCRRI